MKKVYSLICGLLLSFLMITGVRSQDQYEYLLQASGQPEAYVLGSTEYFTDGNGVATPLLISEVWSIHAEINYKGKPAGYWGSRLFQAITRIGTSDTIPEFNSATNAFITVDGKQQSPWSRDYPFTFYLRPARQYVEGFPGDYYTGQVGRLLLANGTGFWSDQEIPIDTLNGTLFVFDIYNDAASDITVACTVNGIRRFTTYEGGSWYWSSSINGQIEKVWGVCAGSNYDTEVTVYRGEIPAVIVPPADVDFGYTLKDESSTKTVKIQGLKLKDQVNIVLGGADKDAFSVSTSWVSSAGGDVEITFSPTEKRKYSAIMALVSLDADPVNVNLSGDADFDFPFQISSGANEYWYYIQFARQAAANTVIQAEGEDEYLTQSPFVPGKIEQQWKIVGSWDSYKIVNRGVDQEWAYDASVIDGSPVDKYVANGDGDEFKFVIYSDSVQWQLFNQFIGYYYATDPEGSPTRRYVNDKSGTAVGSYTTNNAGNPLTFIPADQDGLYVGADSIGLGGSPVGATISKTINIAAIGVTSAVSYSISGAGFTATATTPLTAIGGALTVSFTPTAAADYEGTITITADSYTQTVKLTGTGLPLNVQFSNGSEEHWYFMQFEKQILTYGADIVIQSEGLDVAVSQQPWDREAAPTNQQWKFVGTWDNCKIVNRDGNLELRYEATSPADRYVVSATGSGDSFKFERYNTTTKWWLSNLRSGLSYPSVNNSNANTYVTSWSGNTDGDVINFIPADQPAVTVATAALSIGFADVGTSVSNTLSVGGYQLTGDISVAITGAGAAAFSVDATLLPAEGGDLVVTFEPTAAQAYTAVLTLTSAGAQPIEVALTATSLLPITISTDGAEHWYMLQFTRRASSSRVWSISADGLSMAQEVKDETKASQYWKITGSGATGYYFINYANGKGLYLNDSESYVFADGENTQPDAHRFVPYGTSEWQFLNETYMTEAGLTSTDRAYLNDLSGASACIYNMNDDGNRVSFIAGTPPSQEAINAPSAEWGEKIATRYYNLQGMRVENPTQGGIYIRQDVYSRHTKTTKVLVK